MFWPSFEQKNLYYKAFGVKKLFKTVTSCFRIKGYSVQNPPKNHGFWNILELEVYMLTNCDPNCKWGSHNLSLIWNPLCGGSLTSQLQRVVPETDWNGIMWWVSRAVGNSLNMNKPIPRLRIMSKRENYKTPTYSASVSVPIRFGSTCSIIFISIS